jgi:hypothetical protein
MPTGFEATFTDALLLAEGAAPAGLGHRRGPDASFRFGIYRNNVQTGLVRALASRFPAAERIVGEAFFAAMAAEFVRRHRPTSPVLLDYGDEFADFVATFEPAGDLDYLPDVIRIEIARSKAYHAPDQQPLAPAQLAAVPPDRLPSLRFRLHPSASIVRSPYPAAAIWAMNAGSAPVSPIEDWEPEDVLIVRPQMTLLTRTLPPGGAAFLQALGDGQALQAAAERALAETPSFDLSANLVGALESGVLADIV